MFLRGFSKPKQKGTGKTCLSLFLRQVHPSLRGSALSEAEAISDFRLLRRYAPRNDGLGATTKDSYISRIPSSSEMEGTKPV